MLETIQCDICGHDYKIDTELFSPNGTEYVRIRLADFKTGSVRYIHRNTCPECTRMIFEMIDAK